MITKGTKNTSTKDTTPRHIWMDEVIGEAIKLHAAVAAAPCKAGEGPLRERMNRAYEMGEPVWMVAEELAHRVKYEAIERRAQNSESFNSALKLFFRSRNN